MRCPFIEVTNVDGDKVVVAVDAIEGVAKWGRGIYNTARRPGEMVQLKGRAGRIIALSDVEGERVRALLLGLVLD